MIAIVDTGGANLASVVNALNRLQQKAELTQDPDLLKRASHVILPGVGAGRDAMERVRKADLIEAVRELKQPVLGICLGMQLLFDSSEEGNVDCLGIIPGRVRKLAQLVVPHMGWNQVEGTGPLYKGLAENSYFYFVHSFVVPEGPWVTGRFDYGGKFTASIEKDNFFGVQFHPERSAGAGHELLRNFLCL